MIYHEKIHTIFNNPLARIELIRKFAAKYSKNSKNIRYEKDFFASFCSFAACGGKRL